MWGHGGVDAATAWVQAACTASCSRAQQAGRQAARAA